MAPDRHKYNAPETEIQTSQELAPSHHPEDGEPKIEEGSRNVDLTSVGGTLRKYDLGYDAIREGLLIYNQERYKEPLSEFEVAKVARSVNKYPPSPPNAPKIMSFIADSEFGQIHLDPICLTANYTDQGNAQVFATLFKDMFLYDHRRKTWMVWSLSHGKWQEDTNGAADRAMAFTLQCREVMVRSITDDAERSRARTSIRNAENGRAMPNALAKAASFRGITISTEAFDTNPWTLNAQGTLLDLSPTALQSGEFTRATVPGDFISKSAGAIFDWEATAPRWNKFLHEIFSGDLELIAYIQRLCGYMLTGDTSEHAIWIAYGGGANGKGTFINVIQDLLGDYGQSTPFNTFDAANRNQYGNDIAALRGARFVAASETESERRLSEARVKSITGGDRLTCRFLYGEFFSFWPQFKILLAVNHKPAIRNTDRGIWRRVKLIPFNVNFEAEMDKHLREKLKAELPGILNWALEGLRAWHEEGMHEPDSVKVATEEYRRESDTIGQWILERAGAKAGESTSSTEAYLDYKAWAEGRGDDKPFALRSFSQTLDGRELLTDPDNPDSERVKLSKRQGTAGGDKGKMFFLGLTLRPLTMGAKAWE